MRGFARDDLFVVVHDLFHTDTADYADLLLPATSQLEHLDVHGSYGHLHVQANNPSIAPLGEALPNTELFRRLAAAMGYDEPCFRAFIPTGSSIISSAATRTTIIILSAPGAGGWTISRIAPFEEVEKEVSENLRGIISSHIMQVFGTCSKCSSLNEAGQ